MRSVSRPSLLAVFSLATVLLVATAPRSPAVAGPDVRPAPAATPEPEKFTLETLQRLRARLDDKDRQTALRAIHVALSQLSDGATFVWRKKSRRLAGVIKPTSAFRNADGRVCRHLIYSLSLGRYVKSIEGVACRGADGRWWLTG